MNDAFIRGFVKQAASHGLNEHEAVAILKEAGAFRNTAAANVRGLDEKIKNDEYIRKNHPFQYALNPLVPGPLSEMYHRLKRREQATTVGHPILGSLRGTPLPVLMGGAKAQEYARNYNPIPGDMQELAQQLQGLQAQQDGMQ
jgi:hypothetical protein